MLNYDIFFGHIKILTQTSAGEHAVVYPEVEIQWLHMKHLEKKKKNNILKKNLTYSIMKFS